MMSKYQKSLLDKFKIKPGKEKLLLSLNDKKKMIVHYSLLKTYLNHGLKLKKVTLKDFFIIIITIFK